MAHSDGNRNTLHGIIDTYFVNPFNNFLRSIEGLATGSDEEKPLQSIIGEKNKDTWYPYFLDVQGLSRQYKECFRQAQQDRRASR